jgi:hypothetical protein
MNFGTLAYKALLYCLHQDGTTMPRHVGFDVCHKLCVTECICWEIY